MKNRNFGGNDNIFIERVVELHASEVYRLAYFLMRNHADAEDVMQDVFLRFFHSECEFEDDGKIRAWLYRVTENRCRDIFRTASRRRDVPIEYANDLATQEYIGLFNELKKLPKKYVTVLYLYYYGGYNVTEIGEMLGRKTETVKTQLKTARKKLKDILGGDYE